MAVALAAGLRAGAARDDRERFHFVPDSLVLTRSVYTGTAETVTIGENLPPGCPGGANGSTVVAVPTTTPGVSTSVTVPCGIASDSGEFPNDTDSHNIWNNSSTDGSFGISWPILLDNLTREGELLGTLRVPTDLIVTKVGAGAKPVGRRKVTDVYCLPRVLPTTGARAAATVRFRPRRQI